MAINYSKISDQDRDTLDRAYQDLMNNRRQPMIDGMASIDQSAYFRGVIVDSIINGLMAHFTEFARNKSVHTEEIRGWGGSFELYVENRVDQVYIIFTQLPASATPAPQVDTTPLTPAQA